MVTFELKKILALLNNHHKPHYANYYTVLIKRLFVAFIFLLISRLLFFTFNFSGFEGASYYDWMVFVVAGMRFRSLSTLCYQRDIYCFNNLPIPWRKMGFYQKISNTIFYLTNSVVFL